MLVRDGFPNPADYRLMLVVPKKDLARYDVASTDGYPDDSYCQQKQCARFWYGHFGGNYFQVAISHEH